MQTEALRATCGAKIDLFLYHKIGMFQIGVVSSALVQKNRTWNTDVINPQETYNVSRK